MEWLLHPEAWISLITLSALEIVLGIDNLVFISIISGKLRPTERTRARRLGLGLASLVRILLLLALLWLIGLTQPLFEVLGMPISWRDMILIGGGLFLLAKSALEMHDRLEGPAHEANVRLKTSFSSVIGQILLLDIVFSLDSVITAVGMSSRLPIMVAAILIAMLVMIVFSASVGSFVERHPTLQVLALSFLFLIGMALMADGLHYHIPKGYLYFSMAFATAVELLNMRLRGKGFSAHRYDVGIHKEQEIHH